MRLGIAQPRHARPSKPAPEDASWCWEVEAGWPGESVERYLRAASGRCELLLFPEGFPFYPKRRDEGRTDEDGTVVAATRKVGALRTRLQREGLQPPAVIVGGDLRETPDGGRRQASLFVSDRDEAPPYFKNRLWGSEWSDERAGEGALRPGVDPRVVWELGDWQIIPRICADVLRGRDKLDVWRSEAEQDAELDRLLDAAREIASKRPGRTLVAVSADAGGPRSDIWKASLRRLAKATGAWVAFSNMAGYAWSGAWFGGGAGRVLSPEGSVVLPVRGRPCARGAGIRFYSLGVPTG